MAGSRSSTSTDALAEKVTEATGASGQVEKAAAAKGLYQRLDELKPEISRALPSAMSADRFTRLVLTQVRANPDLMKCDPDSVLAAALLAAQTGLEPGPFGHAYFVPRWNSKHHKDERGRWVGAHDCQFQIGYRGYVDLAYRSKNITSIQGWPVYPNETFVYEAGVKQVLRHKPEIRTEHRGGEAWCFYAIARLTNGEAIVRVMSVEDVEAHRLRAPGQESGVAGRKGPWKTDYEAMAIKTVIHSMARWLPLSAEVADIVAQDGAVHSEISERMAEQPVSFDPDVDDVIDVDSEEVEASPADIGGQDEEGEGEASSGGASPDPTDGRSPAARVFDGLDDIKPRTALAVLADDLGVAYVGKDNADTIRRKLADHLLGEKGGMDPAEREARRPAEAEG